MVVDEFFKGYGDFNTSRLDHLRGLGLDLKGKRVLEVGAGIGLLTHFWKEMDCDVVSTEGQESHVKRFKELHPDWKVYQVDLGVPDSHRRFGKFDIVFCYGVLYHVPDPVLLLHDMSKLCKGLFLLESLVWHKDDGELHQYGQGVGADQGLTTTAFNPARDWIMAALRDHFPYAYVTKQQPAWDRYPTKWPCDITQISRAVFVASQNRLDLPTLTEELPMEQECV